MALEDKDIEKIVKATLNSLNGEKDAIADRTVKVALKEMHPLTFENEEEKREFKKAIPELIAFYKSVENTKRKGKYIGGALLLWVLKDMYEAVWPVIKDFFATDVNPFK